MEENFVLNEYNLRKILNNIIYEGKEYCLKIPGSIGLLKLYLEENYIFIVCLDYYDNMYHIALKESPSICPYGKIMIPLNEDWKVYDIIREYISMSNKKTKLWE